MPIFKTVFPTNGPAVTLTPDKIIQQIDGIYSFRAVNRADLHRAVTSARFAKLLKNPTLFSPAPYVALRGLDDVNDTGPARPRSFHDRRGANESIPRLCA